MGDPKRPRKKYSTPPHPWQIDRIESESKLVKSYGLKTKRELWKHKTQLSNYRERARKIANMSGAQAELLQKELFSKLTSMGIIDKNDATLDDVLSLEVEEFLSRRLQTLVYRKGLAFSPKQARQFIVHGHVAVDGNTVSIPSYTVLKSEEKAISFKEGGTIQKGHDAVPGVVKKEEKLVKLEKEEKDSKPDIEKIYSEKKEEAKPKAEEKSEKAKLEMKKEDAKTEEKPEKKEKKPAKIDEVKETEKAIDEVAKVEKKENADQK
ncbi:30S ribosomal protein S4 [Candidatus Undinarchaeota archaeon]